MAAKHPTGTQSIERALRLLELVVARRPTGWRLTDLVSRSGLDDSTVLRIVSCLSEMGLVRRRNSDRHYVPGPRLYELAVSLPAYFEFQLACHPSLVKIARQTGWTTCLYLRSTDETVLIDRAGDISQLFNNLGSRRHLMTTTQGIAMLIALPPEEQRAVIATYRKASDSASTKRPKNYQQILERSRQRGFGLNLGDAIPGWASIAVPILTPRGNPLASIGVSGPRTEFPESRVESVASLMQKEAIKIVSNHKAIFDSIEAD